MSASCVTSQGGGSQRPVHGFLQTFSMCLFPWLVLIPIPLRQSQHWAQLTCLVLGGELGVVVGSPGTMVEGALLPAEEVSSPLPEDLQWAFPWTGPEGTADCPQDPPPSPLSASGPITELKSQQALMGEVQSLPTERCGLLLENW